MKHMTRKINFATGHDANKMLFRKMCYNFFLHGKIVTTRERAKTLKSLIDTLVSKTKEKTQGNKNYILRYIQDKKMISDLFDRVGPQAKSINGGYISFKRLHVRSNDGAHMAELTWAHGIVLQKPELPVPSEKNQTEPKKSGKQVKEKKSDEKKDEKGQLTSSKSTKTNKDPDSKKQIKEDTNSQEK